MEILHPRRRKKDRGLARPPDPSRLPGARRAALPQWLTPQLATLVSEAPEGDEWLHEIKLDGYRLLGRIEEGKVRLLTRNRNDWTASFPTLRKALEAFPVRALLDGEVVSLDENGVSNFQALQNAIGTDKEKHLVYQVFDVLHFEGYDLTQTPLIHRKMLLKTALEAIEGDLPIRFLKHIEGNGREFHVEACRVGLEGIVSKRKNGRHHPGRSKEWLKIKCALRQEFVIGGFTEPEGTRTGLGSLLLGLHDRSGGLRYVGRVGTGFTRQSLEELRGRLEKMEEKDPPFIHPPPGAQTGRIHWVRPELVAEVKFTGWTQEGILRHPSFEGLREDKPARKVVLEREQPLSKAEPPRPEKESTSSSRHPGEPEKPHSSVAAPGHRRSSATESTEIAGVRLTHPHRVLYPEQGITKLQLARFYETIADRILPYMEGRPLTLVRCPEGHEKGCFIQRHARETVPAHVRRIEVREGKLEAKHLMVDSLQGLISLIQMGVLEIHTWGARWKRLETPDQMIFDLDPDPSVSWERVIETALLLRARLADLGLESFLKTSGGKGLHVLIPLSGKQGWEEVRNFSKGVAVGFVSAFPDRYVATMSKARRKGRIFIDYLRNARGATTVAPYSTRAKAGAPVSTPVGWSELGPRLRPDSYTVENLPGRLVSLRKDPWAGYGALRQSITKDSMRKLGLS